MDMWVLILAYIANVALNFWAMQRSWKIEFGQVVLKDAVFFATLSLLGPIAIFALISALTTGCTFGIDWEKKLW